MFKDTKEELQRLEAELLADEPTQRIPRPTQMPQDETEAAIDAFLTEERPAEHPGAYANYANGYGCRAYNSDKTELDPEELSQQLLDTEAEDRYTGLWVTIILLLIAILGVLGYLILKMTGVLG